MFLEPCRPLLRSEGSLFWPGLGLCLEYVYLMLKPEEYCWFLARIKFCWPMVVLTDSLVLHLQLLHDGHFPHWACLHDFDANSTQWLCQVCSWGGWLGNLGEFPSTSSRQLYIVFSIWSSFQIVLFVSVPCFPVKIIKYHNMSFWKWKLLL